MQIDPKVAIWLNVLYAILTGFTAPMLQAAGIADATHVLAWMAMAAMPLNVVLHSFSSTSAGPMVGPQSPVPPAAKLGLMLALGAALLAIGPKCAKADPVASPVGPIALHVTKHIVRHHVVKMAPMPAKLSLNLSQLLSQLQAMSLADLQSAQADAVAQKDTVASGCYGAIITIVSAQQAALNAQSNLTSPHLVTDFQHVRDFAKALQSDSPLSVACAPLANEVKMDVLNLVAGITAGTLTLSSFGL